MTMSAYEQYEKIRHDYAKLLVESAMNQYRLKQAGYDEETGDFYNPEYEVEFVSDAEWDLQEGEVVIEEHFVSEGPKPKKEDMN